MELWLINLFSSFQTLPTVIKGLKRFSALLIGFTRLLKPIELFGRKTSRFTWFLLPENIIST